jgi:4-hydroxy-2-oxoheptanedioate aldolase
MGHLGDAGHAEVQAAIAEALTRCRRAGKPAGILTGDEGQARAYLEAGFTFVGVGSDLGVLVKHADGLASRFRDYAAAVRSNRG